MPTIYSNLVCLLAMSASATGVHDLALAPAEAPITFYRSCGQEKSCIAATVVDVDATTVSMRGKLVARIAGRTQFHIPELTAALKKPTHPSVLLFVHRDTPYVTVASVIYSAALAGRSYFTFAVRPPDAADTLSAARLIGQTRDFRRGVPRVYVDLYLRKNKKFHLDEPAWTPNSDRVLRFAADDDVPWSQVAEVLAAAQPTIRSIIFAIRE